jgi:hypothetical protein
MIRKNLAAALTMGLCTLMAQAGTTPAAPLVTFEIEKPGDNLTFETDVSTTTGSRYARNDRTQSESTRTVVVKAPTADKAGLEYDYLDQTTKYTDVVTKYKLDNLSTTVATAGANGPYADGKYLLITGSATAAADTHLTFNLSAAGAYLPKTLSFGEIAPGLPTFYFGSSFNALALVPHAGTSIDSAAHLYNTSTNGWSNDWSSLYLAAGTATNFAALVYAANDVSVNSFNLRATSGEYDVVTTSTPYAFTSHTLTAARTIAPIPEPQTYAMLLAGLGLIGAGRRKRQPQA